MFILRINVLLILLLYFANGHSQAYHSKNLTVNEGLPSNQIYFVIEDSKGFIWIGTSNGVCRWDSKNFEYFTIKDGLPNNEVLSIFEDSKGRIWFSTFSDELCYYFDGKIINGKINSTLAKIKVEYSTPLVELGSIIYANHAYKQCIKINLDNLESSITDDPPHISNTIAYKKQLFHLGMLSKLKSQNDSIQLFQSLTSSIGYRSYRPNALSKFLDSIISPKYNHAKLLKQKKTILPQRIQR